MVAREHEGDLDGGASMKLNDWRRMNRQPDQCLREVSEEYSVRPSAKSERRAGETCPFIDVGKADVGRK